MNTNKLVLISLHRGNWFQQLFFPLDNRAFWQLRQKQVWPCYANIGGFTGIFTYLLTYIYLLLIKLSKRLSPWNVKSKHWTSSYSHHYGWVPVLLPWPVFLCEIDFVSQWWLTWLNKGELKKNTKKTLVLANCFVKHPSLFRKVCGLLKILVTQRKKTKKAEVLKTGGEAVTPPLTEAEEVALSQTKRSVPF